MTDRQDGPNGTTSAMESNGGVGHYQPSHYVSVEIGAGDPGERGRKISHTETDTYIDENGQTHVAGSQTVPVRKISDKSDHIDKCNNVNVSACRRSSCTRKLWCYRQLTVREKYLAIVCLLLFLSCLAFVLVAFVRDKHLRRHCPCHDSPTIASFYRYPQDDPSVSNRKPHIVLVCNSSALSLQTSPDLDHKLDPDSHHGNSNSHVEYNEKENDLDTPSHPKVWWTLPDGRNVSGSKLFLYTVHESGPFTCYVEFEQNGENVVLHTSTFIEEDKSTKLPEVCLTENCIKTAAQLLDSMDGSVDPCDDFFEYACGNWNKKNFIPEDRPSYNTFEKLYDDLQLTLRALLEDTPKDYDSNATLKAKILYQSCINISQIEAVGDAPLRKLLEELGRWPVIDKKWRADNFVLEDVLGDMLGKYNAPILIDVWIGPDDKNSSINILQLDEPALGMPSREYYLHDQNSPDVRAYLKYMCDVAYLLGADPDTIQREMAKVLEFETKIANASTPQNMKHDTGARYNKMTIGQVQKRVPDFDWLRYFNRFLPAEVDFSEEMVVFAPNFLKEMVDLVQVTDKRVVSNFVLWRLILGFIPELTAKFQEVRNEYRTVMQEVTRSKPRWNKCVEYLNDQLGPATGAMFVHEKFRKKSKDVALEMIENLREAFIELLNENNWMDDQTREVAREKAKAIKERIGYPDYIVNPTELDKKLKDLHFKPDEYFENILRVERYDANRMMAWFRQPVDKDVWEQDPAVVNAFYNPNTNDIVFPAGMLQPPFYSEYFPKSLNYGGIGVVIGHEITHGFDDKGRQFDKDGNMKQWWKNETIEAFHRRNQCIINQYSNVQLEQIGKNIDGKNTQGENIADNGGLKQAYRAYKKYELIHGVEPLLPGLNMTHDQLFFLNFAQIWCGNMRDKAALEKIRTSVHSPGPIRAKIPLSNSEDFAKAYSCTLGSPMNPKHKCAVW
ncbi:neprilysin-1-like [Mya arenaria]|uniref:neprilysin-1-like n=1 Tax=Mya arenaria TaxID=6604 RepID=UPI0022E53D92|nr:neprilysin-1-like [Mya arenaria]XP_052821501.1 neprilysin-1-like [Mya arenaria]XP_052821502.1 neprilysin-1-like [Mya arenaria]XP_052821503.1 neprilysin-1-like [Mya arenaria]